MHIRPEVPSDYAAVHDLNVAAFGGDTEARLVAMLREQARPLVSLVAEESGTLVGHIMFSPLSLQGFAGLMMGLGPMAVAPTRQRQGVGSALVRAGLERCREIGAGAVVVLGHPDYYPKFGFLPAARFGLTCE
jgi:putative acetyltransferase